MSLPQLPKTAIVFGTKFAPWLAENHFVSKWQGARMANKRRQEIRESQLQGLKYFKLLGNYLKRLKKLGTVRDRAGNRKLFADQYFCLLLLYFFNSSVTSLRAIQQTTKLEKVQKLLGVRKTALGSLSEAARVFDADALRDVFLELTKQAQPLVRGREAELLKGLTAADGTVFRALPKMTWALWNGQSNGFKMHLQFDILAAAPVEASITPAASSEPDEFQLRLQPGRLYVLDRGYASYFLAKAILGAQSSFVLRFKDDIAYTVKEERALTDADCQAGVIRDVIIDRLGTSHHKCLFPRGSIRLVLVRFPKRDGTLTDLYLLTDKLDLPAELIALAYQYRWTIELFFRWFKCILGCRHLLSMSENGIQLQVYAALIASLLITLWTGRKPNKRTFEMLQFYLTGWATLEELEAHIATLAPKESA